MWTGIGRVVDDSESTGVQTIGGEQGQKVGDVALDPPALGGGGGCGGNYENPAMD